VAGADKEEFPPLLAVGFHPMNLVGLRRVCVERFPASITRPSIMRNLEGLIGLINQNRMAGSIWVDGSFLTQKLNPDDVDLILVLASNFYLGMDAQQRQFFNWFSSNSLYDSYRCDNYGVVLDRSQPEGEWSYAYWLRQFGFSRGNDMKGMALIQVPFLVTP
jgi:hypothetical protein